MDFTATLSFQTELTLQIAFTLIDSIEIVTCTTRATTLGLTIEITFLEAA